MARWKTLLTTTKAYNRKFYTMQPISKIPSDYHPNLCKSKGIVGYFYIKKTCIQKQIKL